MIMVIKKQVTTERPKLGDVTPVKEGKKVLWDVYLGKRTGFLCGRQVDAEILSSLVRIEAQLANIKKQISRL